MTADDRAQVAALVAAGRHAEVDQLLLELHREYHDRPLAHVRVHLAWARVKLSHRSIASWAWAAGHVLAGLVVAAPASLAQRHLGLVVPAFDARRSR